MRWLRAHPSLSLLAAIIVLLAVIYPLHGSISRARVAAELDLPTPLLETRVSEDVLSWAMGWAIAGFRQIAVTIAWVEAQEALEQRDWFELRVLYDWISYLQPHSEAVWEFNSRTLTERIERLAPTPQEGWKWVQEGLRVARRGVRRKPRSSRLRHNLAWIYYECGQKGADPDTRWNYYKRMIEQTTGMRPYQHAIEIMDIAWKIDRCGVRRQAEMIPYAYEARAAEAEQRGELDEMKRCRQEAIDWFDKIASVYKRDMAADQMVQNLRLKLRAHQKDALAAEAAARGETARELEATDEAFQLWRQAFRQKPRNREIVRHLKKLAARYERALAEEKDPELIKLYRSKRIARIWLDLREHRVPAADIDRAYARLCDRYSRLMDDERQKGDLDTAARRALALSTFALALLQRQEVDEPPAPAATDAARRLTGFAQELREAGVTRRADEVLLQAAELWRILFVRKHGEDGGVPALRAALQHYAKAEGAIKPEDEQALHGNLVKQTDLHFVLMIAGGDAEQHERSLRAIAKRCTDHWARAADPARRAMWRGSAIKLYSYFLNKDLSDEEARCGWQRLQPEAGAEAALAAAPGGRGALWVVYLFPLGIAVVGLSVAHLLRRRIV